MNRALMLGATFCWLACLPFASSAYAAESSPRDWRVMVILPEQHIRRPVPDPAAETEIIRQFLDKGFRLIDQKQFANVRADLVARLRKDPKAARSMGKDYGADLIVYGEAFSVLNGRIEGGFISCGARVECRVVMAESGEILAADGTDGAGAASTEEVAAKQALQRTARKLAPALLERLGRALEIDLGERTGRALRVEVTGLTSFEKGGKILDLVKGLEGVREARQETYRDGVMVLSVDWTGKFEELARLLNGSAFQRQGYKVEHAGRTLVRLVPIKDPR